MPEGFDRARRAYAAACLAVGHHETAARALATPDPVDAEAALDFAHALVGFTVAYRSRGLGLAERIVCLRQDSDGRLVEAAP